MEELKFFVFIIFHNSTTMVNLLSRRDAVFAFLASQQKGKRSLKPLRTLRL